MNYQTPITSAAAARRFIVDLHRSDRLFHFDDSPETIIDRSGARVFDDADLPHLSARVAELFDLLPDPFELAVALTSYPEFFDMDQEELEARIDVYWQITVPNSDDARNVDPDATAENEALEFALQIMKEGETA